MNKTLLSIFLVMTAFGLFAQERSPIDNPDTLKIKLKQQSKPLSSTSIAVIILE